MPTNIGHEALTGLKVGHQNVSAGYLGHQQVFPNSAQITSAVFTDTTNAAYTGGTRTFTSDFGTPQEIAQKLQMNYYMLFIIV